MKEPTLEQIDAIRKEGFRPGVVSCIVHDKKILMFYKEEYKLWLLPQGGINNGERPIDALNRELIEEVGAEFTAQLDFDNAQYFENDRMEFKPGRHEMHELHDDSGKEIQMLGKDYMLYAIPAKTEEIDVEQTEYDQCHWMSFHEAYFIAERIYQKGKKRVTIKILTELQKLGLIE